MIKNGTDFGTYLPTAGFGELDSDALEVSSVPLSIWCDNDGNGEIQGEEQADDNRVWVFGDENDYPALRCVPNGLESQRNWFEAEGARLFSPD